MKRRFLNNLFCALLLMGNFYVAFSQNVHVLFGEQVLKHPSPAIFMDRYGYVYPEFFISDTSMQHCNSSLKDWYKAHPKEFKILQVQYHCNESTNFLNDIEVLNDSILSTVQRNFLLKNENNSSISFLFHGFRKPYLKRNIDTNSPSDYEITKKALIDNGLKNTRFVEVYWDGLYDCCFSANNKRNEALFLMFEEAQMNASYIGQGFKKVLHRLPYDTINIITHSLGAKVAAYALFNVNEEDGFTPANKRVNLCLMAPAIGADLISKNYYKRNSGIDFTKNDNYKLIIVYNERDFALLKKDLVFNSIGPGPFKHGNTTLGCNYENSAINLTAQFKENFSNSSIELIHFNDIGKCHLVSCYFRSSFVNLIVKAIRS